MHTLRQPSEQHFDSPEHSSSEWHSSGSVDRSLAGHWLGSIVLVGHLPTRAASSSANKNKNCITQESHTRQNGSCSEFKPTVPSGCAETLHARNGTERRAKQNLHAFGGYGVTCRVHKSHFSALPERGKKKKQYTKTIIQVHLSLLQKRRVTYKETEVAHTTGAPTLA